MASGAVSLGEYARMIRELRLTCNFRIDSFRVDEQPYTLVRVVRASDGIQRGDLPSMSNMTYSMFVLWGVIYPIDAPREGASAFTVQGYDGMQ